MIDKERRAMRRPEQRTARLSEQRTSRIRFLKVDRTTDRALLRSFVEALRAAIGRGLHPDLKRRIAEL